MKSMLKALLIVGVLSVYCVGNTNTANADHNPYWRGYWGWYDNTYTPYHSYYYSSPSYYGGNYGPGYGGYYTTPYSSGYYSPGPRVDVRVGPGRDRVRFGWW